MRIWLQLLMCLVLSEMICGCALAVGKITVDPNVGGSVTSKAPAVVDTRLAQQVTYEARHTPVWQILDDLSLMTGIKLYCGRNKSDWPVRVFTPEMRRRAP